jgi:predicted porin
VDYALSARTSVFAKTGIYNNLSGTVAADTNAGVKQTSSAIGVKTTF